MSKRRFVEVDTNEAVKIGDLDKNSDQSGRARFQQRECPRRASPGRGGRIHTSRR